MSALTVVPTPPSAALTLFACEENLAALVSTADMVPPDQELEFAAALTQARGQAMAKRDAVSRFLAHLKSQSELAAAEIAILQKRRAVFERAERRVKALVVRVITNMGKDAAGKWLKLEGATTTLSLRGCTKAVEVTDETAVPARFKRATVTLPAPLWEKLIDSADLDLAAEVLEAVRSPKLEVSNSAVKRAIDAGEAVDGAKLTGGVYVVRT